MNRKKPIIGITLDHKENGEYSKFPWYALRENYFRAIELAGGVPLGIPYHHAGIPYYLELIDGLLVPGGPHDIDPSDYGESSCHQSVCIKNYRAHFDRAIMQGALEQRMPLLGICAGQQMLNVIRGGTLIQHIPDTIDSPFTHEASRTPHLAVHPVYIQKGTLLFDIIRLEEIEVNSTHHQAVKKVGHGLVVNALAPDGIIEGIEDPSHSFCLGVEWHPEYGTTDMDRAIFKRFIQEATTSR